MKHKTYSIIIQNLLLLFVFALPFNTSAQSWQPLGSDDFNQISYKGASHSSITLDNSGMPYILYYDHERNGKATVKRFNGNSWVTVGTAGFSAGRVTNTSIFLDNTNTPYVAYSDDFSGYTATVMKFDGTAWVNVGTLSTGQSDLVKKIVVDKAGTPYVFYTDAYHTPDTLVIRKFNGTAWVDVGNIKNASTGSIALDNNDTLYSVYGNGNVSGKATVKKFNGTSWVAVGDTGFSQAATYYNDIYVNPNGIPYVFYNTATGLGGYNATVKKYDGTSWVTLGNLGVGASQTFHLSIITDKNDTPYVFYTQIINSKRYARVAKFNGSSWVHLPTPDVSVYSGDIYANKIVVDTAGKVYIGYVNSNPSAGPKAIVKKFDGTDWVSIGAAGVSSGYASHTRIKIDGNNTPYIVYMNEDSISKSITVKKYNGTSWVNVGSAGFAGYGTRSSLAFDAGHTPYVVYQDDSSGSRASVRAFNGTSWIDVGDKGFSFGTVNYPSITLDANGTPYVAYQDNANGNRITVMKYDGTSWTVVGLAGFSAGTASYTNITLDGNGTPYVVYADGGNNAKAVVMKYDGTSWANVGMAGISAGNTTFTDITFDNNNTPYVVYSDGGNNSKATVMKYDGTSWVDVGIAGLPTGPVSYTTISIDGNGMPYVAYSNGYNDGAAMVMKYDGASWVNVGGTGISAGDASYTSMAIDGNGAPYIAYSSGGAAFAKKFDENATAVYGLPAECRDVTIYPNPVENHEIYLEAKGLSKGKYRVRIVNIEGKSMHASTIEHNNNNQSYKLSLPTFMASGIYYVEVVSIDGKIKKTNKIAVK